MSKRSSDPRFEFDGSCSPAEIGEHLETLAKHIKSGRVQLAAGNETIQLELTENVHLAIDAQAKTRKQSGKLSIEIVWRAPVPPSEGIRIAAGSADGDA